MGHRAIKCGRFSSAAIEEVLVKEVLDEQTTAQGPSNLAFVESSQGTPGEVECQT